MANAGTVTVDFAAEVARFNAQLKTVQTSLGRMESGFRSVERVARTALGFLASGVAVAFVKSAADAADQLGKTADKLQIATDRLAAFQLAADDAGVAQETLNKLLLDAQQRLGDAAVGRGRALPFIKQLGLDVKELQELKPDELFLRYSDAILTLKNRSDQLAAAQGLFGDAAKEAFAIIEAGRPAIEAAAETVERLGLALTRTEIKQIEEANDKLGLLSKTSLAFGQQIAAAVAPFVTAFVDSLTNSGVAADSLREKIDQTVATVFFGFQTMRNGVLALEAAFFSVAGAGAKALEVILLVQQRGVRNDVIDALGASAEANFERAKAAADGIRSFAEISQLYIKILEDSRARADAAIAEQQARGTGGTEVLNLELQRFEETLLSKEQLQALSNERLLQQQQAFLETRAQLELGHVVAQEQRRVEAVTQGEQIILQQKQRAFTAATGLLQALASRSKTAAIALIAVNKARAIAETIQDTARGVVFWTARGNLPMAAFTKALGVASVAAIAATGFVEANQVQNFSGPGAPPGSPSNPVFTDSADDERTFGASSQRVVHVHIEGPITGPEATRWLIEEIRNTLDETDTVIISPNSRNGQDLRGG